MAGEEKLEKKVGSLVTGINLEGTSFFTVSIAGEVAKADEAGQNSLPINLVEFYFEQAKRFSEHSKELTANDDILKKKRG